MNYEKTSLVLKAMADPSRMKIIHLLSSGSLCACDVLKHFDFTQPTLSHHMKSLEKAGIVSVTKQSQWHYYALKETFIRDFMDSMVQLLSDQKNQSYTKKEIVIT
ncbi:ArsR/SmtB family transcription factor [Paenilisteria rocourtiae]|uniref:ArsR family transcriptional regulator n=2 Tax=Listeria rocourtiae TaxID=647910 RepID=A0A4R6ZHQ0_9LIST|nr:metalloregulator ArsR/SmtB family transcription factor [Listeria rocourtiae]EUJ46615.1 ArsR family transcriptional regulator [Listeria rocourtiae FSL F6-920]MBC1605319.1 winged helix-turn-helix transcriptional regulator [Listeria rocourtiae]TDR51780.1 ArsR family transcriptional regulator [Listeria rocourtiae]